MNYKYFPIMNNRTGNHSGHGHEDDLKPWESGRFLERSYKHIGGWDIFVHDPSDNWWGISKDPTLCVQVRE